MKTLCSCAQVQRMVLIVRMNVHMRKSADNHVAEFFVPVRPGELLILSKSEFFK